MAWAKNGTPDTLTVAGDAIEITDLTAATFNQFMFHVLDVGGIITQLVTFNNNSNAVYAQRTSLNGGTDASEGNRTQQSLGSTNAASNVFLICYLISVSGEEKLNILFSCDEQATGAGTAPARLEHVGKFVPSPDDDITEVKMANTLGGSYDIDSNLSALGDIPEPTPTVGGWVELGRTTLGSASDTITVSGLPDKRYYMVLQSITRSGGLSPDGTRLGNGSADSGNNYATRYSNNGGADIPNTSNNQGIDYTPSVSNDDSFAVQYITNLSDKEKLWQKFRVGRQAVGAGSTPNRSENAAKWANTANLMDVFQTINIADVGSYELGSEAVVLGWDPSDTHTTNFWEELGSDTLTSVGDNLSTGTISARKYLWIQTHTIADSGTNHSCRMTFNDDNASNYSARWSTNGASDSSSTSRVDIFNTPSDSSTSVFTNWFVINTSANEKLVRLHTILQSTAGAGNAPDRTEVAAKWVNTSAQITKIDFDNTSAGDMAIGSTIKVWGSD